MQGLLLVNSLSTRKNENKVHQAPCPDTPQPLPPLVISNPKKKVILLFRLGLNGLNCLFQLFRYIRSYFSLFSGLLKTPQRSFNQHLCITFLLSSPNSCHTDLFSSWCIHLKVYKLKSHLVFWGFWRAAELHQPFLLRRNNIVDLHDVGGSHRHFAKSFISQVYKMTAT